jgi:cell division protein YceG involved in septum cleavage
LLFVVIVIVVVVGLVRIGLVWFGLACLYMNYLNEKLCNSNYKTYIIELCEDSREIKKKKKRDRDIERERERKKERLA